MKKRLNEMIMSCLFIILGVVAILVIQAQTSTSLSNTGSTTFKTFPTLYGSLIIIFSSINALRLVLAGLKEKRVAGMTGAVQEAETAPNPEEKKQQRLIALRVAGMFLLTVAFALLLKKIHFALLSFGFLFLSFLVLGRRKLWLNAVVSAVGSGVIYVIFVILLKLTL